MHEYLKNQILDFSDGLNKLSIAKSKDLNAFIHNYRNEEKYRKDYSDIQVLFVYMCKIAKEYFDTFKPNIRQENPDNFVFEIFAQIKQNKKHKINLSEFSKMNNLFNTRRTSTMFKEIQNNPTWWKKYHQLYRESRKTWSTIPSKYIASKLSNINLKIADLGCGQMLLNDYLPNYTIDSYDYYAYKPSVIVCDYTTQNINQKYDVVVCSLSLPLPSPSMTEDFYAAIQQAYNILDDGGCFFIAEPKSRYEDEYEQLKQIIEETKFVIHELEEIDQWLFLKIFKPKQL